MKSQIKVDYKSRFGTFGDKEPLIRIDLYESDDPRDTLLSEIIKGDDSSRIGIKSTDDILPMGPQQYLLYKKTRGEREVELARLAYHLFSMMVDFSFSLVSTGSDMYFELAGEVPIEENIIRSSGIASKDNNVMICKTDYTQNDADIHFLKKLFNEWKEFESLVRK